MTRRCTGTSGLRTATCWTAVTLTGSARAELRDASQTQNCDGPGEGVKARLLALR